MVKKLAAYVQKKRNSIAFKLLVITILLILCPVIISSTLSFSQYTSNFEQKSAESTYQTIVQLSYDLNSYLNGLFQASGSIYYNNDLMNALENQNPASDYQKLQKEWTIEEQLSETFVNARSDILSAYIISNHVIYRAGVYNESVNPGADYASYDWYKEALKNNDAFYVPTHLEQLVVNPQHKVFSVVRRINSIKSTGKVLGVMKIDINYSNIQSICDKIQIGSSGGLLIEDQNHAVIYSSLKNQNDNEVSKMAAKNKGDYMTAAIGGKKYLLSSIQIPSANWTVISLTSVSELNKTAVKTRNMTFLIALLCSAVAIIILLFFIRSFLRPLFVIVDLMKNVQNGDLTVFFPEKRKDEIGYLGSSFNRMVKHLDSMMRENTTLIREVYETRLLQNEAQINALYSQIKPHFLFNTLNMISLLVRCNKNEVAVDNIDKLSDLLRCMTHFNREVTVKEELRLLDAYLSIQTTRYQDRLEYSIDIDERLNSYVIPALIFQPIVENTIVHGCETNSGKTILKIHSEIAKDCVIFYVEDNALGMKESVLEALRVFINTGKSGGQTPADSSQNNGIGLLNVNKRLKLKFGYNYGLHIDSEENVGTSVQIILPRNREWEEIHHV